MNVWVLSLTKDIFGCDIFAAVKEKVPLAAV